jgi:hypothetical protein
MNQRKASLIALGLAVALIGGCQESDEIRHYKAPRVEYPKGRLLGAIVPRADFYWFFKVDGPPEAVASQEKNYESFIQSLKFSGDENNPVTWTVPEGWVQQPGDKMRFATLTMRAKDRNLELSVTKFDAKSNNVIDNVNRWRGQLDLPKVDDEELARAVKKIKVENEDVILVDILGDTSLVKGSGMRGRMPMAAGRLDLDKDHQPRFPAPPGWREVPPKRASMPDVHQVAAFVVGTGGEQADVTVTLLSRQDSLLQNVNRWRVEQLKLPAYSENDLAAHGRKIACMDGEADYFDLQGSPTGTRMLAVMLTKDRRTWVFKMTGPDGVVGAQKTAFEKFVRNFSL